MDNNLKPLISIGISFYNCEDYIELAVKSVLRQTYSNWELILINDGSSDSSLDIAKRLASGDNRISLVNDDLNLGLARRLNQMIDLSNGEFFVRFDADDIMFPDRIMTQLMAFNNYQDLDIVSSSAVIIDEKNKVTGIRKSSSKLITPLIGVPFIHPTIMGRISWFKMHKYKDGYIRAEDFELWLRTQHNLKFKTLEEPLIFYREGNVNLNNYIKSVKTTNILYKEYYGINKLFYFKLRIKNYLKIVICEN